MNLVQLVTVQWHRLKIAYALGREPRPYLFGFGIGVILRGKDS